MYGLLLEAIGQFIRNDYGENVWNEVRRRAKVEQHTFSTHIVYSESILPRLADAAAELVGTSRDNMLARFGHDFVDFTCKYGYDRFLLVLGRNMREFLNGLDNLHECMHFCYAKMKPPSFYVECEHEYGLTLHYRSKRKYSGFIHYVRGQLEAVGKRFYNVDVLIDIVREEIIVKDDSRRPSLGRSCHMHVVMELRFDNAAAYRESLVNATRDAVVDSKNNFLENFPTDLNFSELFPFHVLFAPDMEIQSTGKILSTVMPDLIGRNVCQMFALNRPLIDFTWESILDHRNSRFELHALNCRRPPSADLSLDESCVDMLSVKSLSPFIETPTESSARCSSSFVFPDRKLSSCSTASSGSQEFLVLKGQMLFLKEWQAMLFVATPKVTNLEHMLSMGNIFLHDLPLHDSTRDLAFLSESDPANLLREALGDVHEKTDALQEALKSLDAEQTRSDTLLYQMLPQQVADRLRAGEPPMNTCKVFDSVTVLVSDIVGFTAMCCRITPLQVVHLLNSVYSAFDGLCEKHQVYKIKTIGDAYLIVSGAPQVVEDHAQRVVSLAFDMVDAIQLIGDPHLVSGGGEHLKIRTGIDSGSAVAGVVGLRMPRYCLFGNTLHRAFKMESTCQPMKVHATDKTYNQLKHQPKLERHFYAVAAASADFGQNEQISSFYLERVQQNGDAIKLCSDGADSTAIEFLRNFSGKFPDDNKT